MGKDGLDTYKGGSMIVNSILRAYGVVSVYMLARRSLHAIKYAHP